MAYPYNRRFSEDTLPGITTEFNSNMARLISLNKLIDDSDEYSSYCYLNGYNIMYLKLWRTTLISILSTIEPKLTLKEKKKVYEMFKKAKKIGRIVKIDSTEDGEVTTIDTNNFNAHWGLLNSIRVELNCLANSKGMQLTDKPKDKDYMSETD